MLDLLRMGQHHHHGSRPASGYESVPTIRPHHVLGTPRGEYGLHCDADRRAGPILRDLRAAYAGNVQQTRLCPTSPGSDRRPEEWMQDAPDMLAAIEQCPWQM